MKFQFVIFDGVEELDLVGSWELVGLLAARKVCEPPELVTLNEMTPRGERGMRFIADIHFKDAVPCDVLFIPGGSGGRIVMDDQEVVDYLRDKGRTCEAVLSVCTGSYLMQKAGLLKGRRATTHWEHLHHLRDDPTIEVSEQRYVNDGNIWSSGGVSAGMDMMLAFIASKFGETVAADVQLDAEYFPSDRIYGTPQERSDVSEYIRNLGKKEPASK